MKLASLGVNKIALKQDFRANETKNESNLKQTEYNPTSYPANYYVNFCGGKSLDLAKTLEQLRKYAKFPQDIEALMQKVINEGNPNKLTLDDIHRQKYNDLLYCDTLEEAKFFFPEFSDVLSEKSVDYNANSFIDRFFRGEFFVEGSTKTLDPNKDLSLQLLQKYYAQCETEPVLLKNYDASFHPVMKKLNIPLYDRTYAHYLTLSNLEKNADISQKISNANFGRKASEETRKNISESLREYYKNNPDIVFSRRKQDMDVLNDPIKSATFSEVLKRAWKYRDADSIKKAMSRFMKKKTISQEEFLEMTNDSQNANSPLKNFWAKNPWAKEKFSMCMEKSWDRQKELEALGLVSEPLEIVHYMPTQLLAKFKEVSPEFGEDIFNREMICIYDTANPVYIPSPHLKMKGIYVSNKIFGEDRELGEQWDLALSQACDMLFNDVAKGNSDAGKKISNLILRYAKDDKYNTFDLFKDIVNIRSIPASQKAKFQGYLDTAWDRVINNKTDELQLVSNDAISNVKRFLGRDAVMDARIEATKNKIRVHDKWFVVE